MRPSENLNPLRGVRCLLDLGLDGNHCNFADGVQYFVRSDNSANRTDRLDRVVRCDLGDLSGVYGVDDSGLSAVGVGVLDELHLDGAVLEHGFSFSRVSLLAM